MGLDAVKTCKSTQALIKMQELAIRMTFLSVFLVFISDSTTGSGISMHGCPDHCLCVSGKDRYTKMDILIQDQHVTEAWTRLTDNAEKTNMKIYFCRNAMLPTVHYHAISTSNALFFEYNNLTTLGKIEFSGEAPDPGWTSPTQALIMSSNKIQYINGSVLRHLPSLELLVLRNNFLEDLNWTISETTLFPNLIELDLSLNKLEVLSYSKNGEFPILEWLDLSGNNIKTVEGKALDRFPRLQHLDLSSNEISYLIPNHPSILPYITFLSLANNSLRDIGQAPTPNFLGMMRALVTLDVSGNKMASNNIPFKAFARLNRLQNLNLSSCDIKYLTRGWLNGGPVKTIKILDLSYNLLSSLKRHDLSASTEEDKIPRRATVYNGTDFPEEVQLQPLASLQVLYINDNYQLTTIEDNVFEFVPHLKMLFLQNCAINKFKIALTEHRSTKQAISSTLPALSNVWIYGNPIACDCDMGFLIEWSSACVCGNNNPSNLHRRIDAPYYFIGSQKKTVQVEFAMCVSPESLSGVAVHAAPVVSMVCAEKSYSIAVAMLIGPGAFAGSIILVTICGYFSTKMSNNKKLSNQREEYIKYTKCRRNIQRQPNQSQALGTFATLGLYAAAPQNTSSTGNIRYRGGPSTNLILHQFAPHHHHDEQPTRKPRGITHGNKAGRQFLNAQHLDTDGGTDIRTTEFKNSSRPKSASILTRSPTDDFPFIDHVMEEMSNESMNNNAIMRGNQAIATIHRDRKYSDERKGEAEDSSSQSQSTMSTRTIPGMMAEYDVDSRETYY